MITILRGLPASGKTTWAKSQKAVRINKDDIRLMIHDGEYSRENESLVCAIRNAAILCALEKGLDIIVDDTNLYLKHVKDITKIGLDHGLTGDEIVIKDFKTPKKECIRRDEERKNPVGSDVINGMANLVDWEES